jgi:hypothetical protein
MHAWCLCRRGNHAPHGHYTRLQKVGGGWWYINDGHLVELVADLRAFLEQLLEMGFYTYTAMYTRTNTKACLSHL